MSEEEFKEKLRGWYRQPNWKKAEDYPSNDVSPDLWAWEFLRRNSVFMEEHSALLKESATLDVAVIKNYKSEWRKKWKAHEKKWHIKNFYAKSFGAKMPSDMDSPCRFVTGGPDMPTHGVKFKEDGPWYQIAEDKQDTVLIRFDLTLPIGPQIKSAEHFLGLNYRGDKTKFANSKKKFPLYLRAFDGYQSTKNYQEVVDFLAAEGVQHDDADYAQNVEIWVERAKEFIESDYWKIPFQFGTAHWQKEISKQKSPHATSKNKKN